MSRTSGSRGRGSIAAALAAVCVLAAGCGGDEREPALGAATLGFLVTYRPEIMGKSAESSVKLLMNFGAESLVQAAAHRFMGGGPAGGGPTGGASESVPGL